MTSTSSTSRMSSNSTNPSPGKQPLSEKAMRAMFASADTADYLLQANDGDLSFLYASVDSKPADSSFWRSKDEELKVLFASGDSMGSVGLPPLGAPPATTEKGANDHFRSIDAVANLVSGRQTSVASQSFLTQFMMASRDSLFGSTDTVSFPQDTEEKKQSFALPTGLYESREWVTDYVPHHKEIEYSKRMFDESSAAPKKTASCDKYLLEYRRALAPKPTSNVTPPLIEAPQKELKKTAPKKPKCANRRVEPNVKTYVEPTDLDILSGRGGRSNNHPGNERYRTVIEDAKPTYRASAKYEKTILSQKIVEQLTEEGRRFLKQDTANGQWFEIPLLAARRKAGQALREENTPEARAEKRKRYSNKK